MFKDFLRGGTYIPACLAASLLFSIGGAHAVAYSTLYSFGGAKHGASPSGRLLIDSSGDLFGTTTMGSRGGVVYELLPSGKENSLFHSFQRAVANSGVIADGVGNLYGTTREGGGSTNCKGGCGTVYKLAPNGTKTILHAFQGGNNDGAFPSGGLVADDSGNLYGTTEIGGIGDKAYCGGSRGCGTVYKVAPDGTETILHFFQPGTTDGILPRAGLIFDSVGNLYGTTTEGGSVGAGVGTVFELSPDNTETIVYSFQWVYNGNTDGGFPYSELVMDAEGNLYGTTFEGGSSTGCGTTDGCGTVFKVATDGTETVLYSFTGGNDGYFPENGLVLDSAGNLYGVTPFGGGLSNCGSTGCGVLFEVSPGGTETVLHDFVGGTTDGGAPRGSLLLSNGNLYGTAAAGGTLNHGTIFQLVLGAPAFGR